MGQRNLNSQNQKLLAKLLSGHEKKKRRLKEQGFYGRSMEIPSRTIEIA